VGAYSVDAKPGLSFTLGLAPAQATGLVRRFAAPVLQRLGVQAEPKCPRGDDPEHDQYSVAQGKSMCWAVLFKNDTGRKHPNSLLGDYGHIERLSSWVHLISGIVFVVYTILRPSVITNEHTLAESCTTAAAGAVAFAFLSSTVYHVTSPSKQLAVWTRQLDYFSIYMALAFGYVADFSIATRSFQNTSILSVLDGPLACVLVTTFFLVRRGLLPADKTWDTYLGGCTLSFGLMRRMHLDLDHTGVRQSTSFLLSISYFVTVPALYSNFGSNEATTILLLELLCLAILVAGMVMDNAFVFPDIALSKGKGPKFLVCKTCGCVGTSHALWHILSVLAAMKGAASREYALSLQR
jgi:predicted membrane channel-forming protein YqfA (hemolysin III family)